MNATLKTGLSVAAAAAALFATTAGVTTAAAADGGVRMFRRQQLQGHLRVQDRQERLQGHNSCKGPGLGQQSRLTSAPRLAAKVEK